MTNIPLSISVVNIMKYFYTILILVGFIGAIPVSKSYWVPKTVWVQTVGFLSLNNIQTSFSLVPGDTVRFTAGTADGFYIENSRFADSVFLIGSDSGTIFTGTGEFKNCKSIVVQKLRWRDFSGRGLYLNGNCDSFTVRNCRWDRGVDYFVQMFESGGNRFDNIQFISDTFRGCGGSNVINTQGAKTKNFSSHNCIFDSTYGAPGSPACCISLTDVADKYLIYQNSYTHINKGCTDHTSVNYLAGNGRFYNNYCFDRQGNFVRFRSYTIDSSASHPTIDTTYCYNNRDVRAIKYASFELQQFGFDTTTNTNLPNIRTGYFIGLNNTTLNGRTADYTPWGNSTGGGSGQFDVYTIFRGCRNANNACGRCYIDSIPNPLSPNPLFTFNRQFHDGGGTRPPGVGKFGDTSNNQYFEVAANLSPNWTAADTLVMNITANAFVRGKGTAAFSYLFTTGYKGNPMGASWPEGADQFDQSLWGPVPWRTIKKAN